MSHDHVEDEAGPLVAVMQRAVAELEPPVNRLAATAQARGRAVRRRRATLSLVTGGVVLALGAVGGVQLMTPTEDRPPVAGPEDARTDDAPRNQWWLQSAAQMERRLEKLLPDNDTIESTSVGPSDPRTGFVRALVSNAVTGSGGMIVRLFPPSGADRLSCPKELEPPDTCVVSGAGATQLREWHRRLGELQVVSVDVAVEGGGRVQAAAANTLEDEWNRSTEVWGPEPSLSVDDLRRIATSPTWQEGGPPVAE